MATIRLYLLGSFHATIDDTPLAGFRSDKARALLAYLVLEAERPVRRTLLANLLWDGYPTSAARTSLRITE